MTLTSEIDSDKIDDELYNLHGREVFLPLKEGSVRGSIHSEMKLGLPIF